MTFSASRYVHLFEHADPVIAFNSLTLESWQLEAHEVASLRAPHTVPDPVPDDLVDLVDAGLLVREVEAPGSATDRLNQLRRERAARQGGRFSTLRIALTERCNMACSYCFQQQLYPDAQPRMSQAQLKEQVDWFVKQAERRPVTVQYFGGEPMLEWDLIVSADGLLRAAVDRGDLPAFRQTMTTNGTVMTRERAQWLHEHGFDVIFSFDGPPQVNDELRVLKSGRGTYDKAAAGLRMWAEAGGAPAILMTATPTNLPHLPRYVRWFLDDSDLGVSTIALNSPQPTATGWEVGGSVLAESVFAIWQECRSRGVEFHGPGTFIPAHLRTRTPQADHCVDGDLFSDGGGSWPVYVSASGERSLCLVHHNDHRVISPPGQEQAAGRRWHLEADGEVDCDTCVASQMCGGPCTLERLLWGPGLRRDRCDFMRTMTDLVLTRA